MERPGAPIFNKKSHRSPHSRLSYAELLYEMYTQTHTTVTHHDTDPYEPFTTSFIPVAQFLF